ncbi:uncharacterized protein C8A04DRAFT_26572 [Dichotomopilus funicola]|uniref:Uncharacterized protein n=1 Tax=Dichotomopilus funicola TaxID=1934379 RepID=A0AAN6V684_9PEZI|nr:hypothetical protein C8A04DRAFT_26572 [Dichotomopilus funicola]
MPGLTQLMTASYSPQTPSPKHGQAARTDEDFVELRGPAPSNSPFRRASPAPAFSRAHQELNELDTKLGAVPSSSTGMCAATSSEPVMSSPPSPSDTAPRESRPSDWIGDVLIPARSRVRSGTSPICSEPSRQCTMEPETESAPLRRSSGPTVDDVSNYFEIRNAYRPPEDEVGPASHPVQDTQSAEQAEQPVGEIPPSAGQSHGLRQETGSGVGVPDVLNEGETDSVLPLAPSDDTAIDAGATSGRTLGPDSSHRMSFGPHARIPEPQETQGVGRTESPDSPVQEDPAEPSLVKSPHLLPSKNAAGSDTCSEEPTDVTHPAGTDLSPATTPAGNQTPRHTDEDSAPAFTNPWIHSTPKEAVPQAQDTVKKFSTGIDWAAESDDDDPGIGFQEWREKNLAPSQIESTEVAAHSEDKLSSETKPSPGTAATPEMADPNRSTKPGTKYTPVARSAPSRATPKPRTKDAPRTTLGGKQMSWRKSSPQTPAAKEAPWRPATKHVPPNKMTWSEIAQKKADKPTTAGQEIDSRTPLQNTKAPTQNYNITTESSTSQEKGVSQATQPTNEKWKQGGYSNTKAAGSLARSNKQPPAKPKIKQPANKNLFNALGQLMDDTAGSDAEEPDPLEGSEMEGGPESGEVQKAVGKDVTPDTVNVQASEADKGKVGNGARNESDELATLKSKLGTAPSSPETPSNPATAREHELKDDEAKESRHLIPANPPDETLGLETDKSNSLKSAPTQESQPAPKMLDKDDVPKKQGTPLPQHQSKKTKRKKKNKKKSKSKKKAAQPEAPDSQLTTLSRRSSTSTLDGEAAPMDTPPSSPDSPKLDSSPPSVPTVAPLSPAATPAGKTRLSALTLDYMAHHPLEVEDLIRVGPMRSLPWPGQEAGENDDDQDGANGGAAHPSVGSKQAHIAAKRKALKLRKKATKRGEVEMVCRWTAPRHARWELLERRFTGDGAARDLGMTFDELAAAAFDSEDSDTESEEEVGDKGGSGVGPNQEEGDGSKFDGEDGRGKIDGGQAAGSRGVGNNIN